MVHRSSLLLAAFICAAILAGPSRAAILLVPSQHPTLQAAIDAATDGDEIRVAPGRYAETIDFRGKDVTVRSEAGAELTTLDAEGAGSPVVFQSGETALAVLEGFTLTGGTGTPVGVPIFGGGMLISSASPTIVDCVIEGNRADFGGGVACTNEAAPTFIGGVIRSNVAFIDDMNPLSNGGGVYIIERSFPLFRSTRIEQNEADFRGGGVFVGIESGPVFEECRIEGNTARTFGGGFAIIENSVVSILDSEILGNHSDVHGGGLFVEDSDPFLFASRIEGNRAELHGGGICCFSGDARVERNRFIANSTLGGGASFYLRDTRAVFAGNVHLFNVAECSGMDRCGGGGGFCDTGAFPVLINETFHGNTSTRRAGGLLSFALANPLLANSIVWGNPGEDDQEITVEISRLTVKRSIVRGGWPGVGNLDVDPMFVDGPAGDVHLRLGSPAADMGSNSDPFVPALDMDGQPRIVDGDPNPNVRVDLGADEMLPEVAVRFGTVGAAGGRVESVLRVNGSAGDFERRVVVGAGEAVTLDLDAPSLGPESAPFVLYLFDGAPDPETLAVLPRGAGTIGFPPPFLGGRPRVIWNNVGYEPLLGAPELPSSPAPTRVVDAPNGTAVAAVVTLQGVILDEGSEGSAAASVTNAVVLEIVP